MSLLTRAFSVAINTAFSMSSKLNPNVLKCSQNLIDFTPGGLYNITARGIIRDHFPRPSEKKRVKRHGWKHRMSTPAGRRILMNRILKGRFIYSH